MNKSVKLAWDIIEYYLIVYVREDFMKLKNNNVNSAKLSADSVKIQLVTVLNAR